MRVAEVSYGSLVAQLVKVEHPRNALCVFKPFKADCNKTYMDLQPVI
jgi:hypothetical protein